MRLIRLERVANTYNDKNIMKMNRNSQAQEKCLFSNQLFMRLLIYSRISEMKHQSDIKQQSDNK